MSQHELSEEQALEVAERAIVDAIGLSYERSMVIAVLAGYAAATGSVWQADTSFEYDRAIHHNPDAKAWADLFVATYPALADKHDVMLGWFANAMMAMHDHLASKQRAAANLAEAERDIARKAWDAAMELARNSDRVLNGFRVVEVGDLWVERDRYLAREYHAPAPEGVTLSDPVLTWHDAGWQRQVLADETGKVVGGIEHATTVVSAHANGASIGQYVTAALAKAAVEKAAKVGAA